jgi:hypothetical protein
LKIDAGPVALPGGIGVLRDHRPLTRTATASTTSTRTMAPGIVLVLAVALNANSLITPHLSQRVMFPKPSRARRQRKPA